MLFCIILKAQNLLSLFIATALKRVTGTFFLFVPEKKENTGLEQQGEQIMTEYLFLAEQSLYLNL